ncbi:MAG: lipoyl(octanoyl) transferase LipB [Phycisphaeraceae bacterium]
MISETIGKRPPVSPNVSLDPPISFRDLGVVPYDAALSVQRELNEAVIAGSAEPTVLLVEHPAVITLTRRAGPNLLADGDRLVELGISTAETDRGGDITYHGPGQLVVYPILKLGAFGLNLSSYMRLLERVVIQTIGRWGIVGHNECGATGVWVGSETADAAVSSAKICAMGVRIRKNTTIHGLALNVAPDLSHFGLIVPCGLDRPVTSMAALLGAGCPSMGAVKAELIERLSSGLAGDSDASVDAGGGCASGSRPGTSAGT